MKLVLKITTEWATHTFVLNPGETILLGRSPDVQVPIARSSVSLEHLKITWTGTELRVEDLNSSNGTVRLPQNSPFREATFAPRIEELKLRLSKSDVTLSWDLNSSTQATAHITSTEMIAPTVPAATSHTPVEQIVGSVAATPRAPDAQLAPVRLVRALKTETISREHARQAAVGTVFCLAGVFVFLLSWFFANWFLRGLLSAPLSLLKAGGFKDLIIIFVGLWVRSPIVCLGICITLIALVVALLRGVNQEKFLWSVQLADRIQRTGFAPRITPAGLGLCLWILAFAWPLIWPLATGVNVFGTIGPAVKMWTLSSNPRSEERVQILNSISEPLLGSSLAYKQFLLVKRARALEECKGQGTQAPWEQKKVCLLLLAAVGIESYEQLQPALVQELAARASILLVLDGVTRIADVDGPDSVLIEFFFGSLASMGLEAEASDIQEILQRKDIDADTKVSTLRDLRRRVEGQLDTRFRRLNLPAVFYFQIPGPLESGI